MSINLSQELIVNKIFLLVKTETTNEFNLIFIEIG